MRIVFCMSDFVLRWPDSAAYDRLEERGHRLLKWRDLWGILSGKHDDFRADEELLDRAG